jgi:uncharacterized protein
LLPSPARSSPRELDLSVGRPGPHAFTSVSVSLVRGYPHIHRIPASRPVTIGQNALCIEAGRPLSAAQEFLLSLVGQINCVSLMLLPTIRGRGQELRCYTIMRWCSALVMGVGARDSVRALRREGPGMSDRLQLHEQLEKELLALGDGVMLIEQFDGLVAGLLVCPELITPDEWLPIVWGLDEDDPQPAFTDLDHANRVLALVMRYYNDVALTLAERPERYDPLFAIDRGEVLWEIWIEGFAEAVRLRPDSWSKLLDADETSDAMLGLLALIEVVMKNKELPTGFVDELTERAHDLIPEWVVTLNDHRLARTAPRPAAQPPMPLAASRRKAGRNEPCPCGSGKKYKKCCGLN